MFRLIVIDSNDVCSLKDNFLTCRCGLYITAIPHPFLFSLLWMIMLYPAVSRVAFMYWYSSLFPHCIQVSVMKHMSRLLSCIWCMSMSNLGMSDYMFISAMLSFFEFHMVLSDLLSSLSKFWWTPLLLSQVLWHICPPLFLLKFHFIFKCFTWLHVSVPILVICALVLRFSNSGFEYLIFAFSFWDSSKIKDNK